VYKAIKLDDLTKEEFEQLSTEASNHHFLTFHGHIPTSVLLIDDPNPDQRDFGWTQERVTSNDL
jgi:hypothetical protein